MKITRKHIRRIILEEMNSLQDINESTSLQSLKQLYDYLYQQGIKFTPVGASMVAYEVGDELIDKVTKGDMEGAAKLFTTRYKNT
jgi:hypothetical protein|tara:strand:- start:540 stop:794 length:255 start_codon:yes stop_codon:yes gene_type:complete